MSTLEIVDVDPFDAMAFDAFHATYLAADGHGREAYSTSWQLEEVRADLQAESPGQWKRGYSGVVDGQVVVSGQIGVPLLDNLDQAYVSVHTHPEHRRRGFGTLMLAHLEQVARERGRTVLNTEAAWPYDAPADGAGSAPAEFLTRAGYTFGLGDVQRELALPVDDALLDRLAAEVEPHHAAYTLRSWVGPAPEDIVESWAALVASLMTEAPLGDLEREPETPDVAVFREREQVLEKQGRTKYNTVALDADGVVVAYTDMVTTVHEPGRVHQWGTLVRRSDRGHRLGMAIKVANLRLLQKERSDIDRMTTYNAEVNDHMIGVNERLGFRPVERLGEFQKRLA